MDRGTFENLEQALNTYLDARNKLEEEIEVLSSCHFRSDIDPRDFIPIEGQVLLKGTTIEIIDDRRSKIRLDDGSEVEIKDQGAGWKFYGLSEEYDGREQLTSEVSGQVNGRCYFLLGKKWD